MTTASDIISKYQRSSEIAGDIVSLGNDLGVDPMFVADLIYFESKFDSAAKNLAGSGATGLIQFMPSRAKALGTTTQELAKMTAKEQMKYVKKYFSADNLGAGNLKKLRDNPTRQNLNMAVFYPKGIGQDPSTEHHENTKLKIQVLKP
jgi:soluble lytic murein transglycosylase-like protein